MPPKSACWFCPFHTLSVWAEMRQHDPAQFWKAAELEAFINARRAHLGRDPVYFTTKGKPLPFAVSEHAQPALFEDEVCDSGYCFV